MSVNTLLGLEGRGTRAWEELGKALKVATEIGSVSAVSSVIREGAIDHQPEKLRAVVLVETALDPNEILIRIKTSSSFSGDVSSFGIMLLKHGEMSVMKPELTLPHPELISEQRWLVLASEIDPEWLHPVLQKSLGAVARPLRFSEMYDFYAQGQTLLAFLSPKT